MLTDLLRLYPDLLRGVDVTRFREDGKTMELIAKVLLHDDTIIHVKDYLFSDGERKYAYQWQTRNGDLIARWDNAPHWLRLATHPRHMHLRDDLSPVESAIHDLHGVLEYIRDRGKA